MLYTVLFAIQSVLNPRSSNVLEFEINPIANIYTVYITNVLKIIFSSCIPDFVLSD